MTASTSTEPFIDGLHFAEGPRWHDDRLWYSDFHDEAVFSVDTAGDRRREVDVPGRPSGLGWLPDGRLLVVCMERRTVLRQEPDGSLVHHGDVAPWATFHANDMVVSADGRAYVGNFGFDLQPMFEGRETTVRTASVVRVDPDGSSEEAATDLSFPNGSVIFPDGRTLVVAETLGARLTAFDVDDDGTLSGRRIWADLPHQTPDGICLDEDGNIWVANAFTAECFLVAEGGRVLRSVETSQPCFACMLGGDDRRTLFCLTAPTSDDRVTRERRGGRIETTKVDVGGAGLP